MAKNKTKRIEKITNGCIYFPPSSVVVDEMSKAKIFSITKTNSEDKNNSRLNLLEIICPRTTIARTYSALFTATSIKRFFSLSLNLILYFKKIIVWCQGIVEYPYILDFFTKF